MAEEAAEEAARVALRAGGRALELGEALRAALVGGRLEIARARYALGAGRVGAFAAPRDRLRARLRVARAGAGDSGVGADPWDLRALAAALPRGAGGGRGARARSPGVTVGALRRPQGRAGKVGRIRWCGSGRAPAAGAPRTWPARRRISGRPPRLLLSSPDCAAGCSGYLLGLRLGRRAGWEGLTVWAVARTRVRVRAGAQGRRRTGNNGRGAEAPARPFRQRILLVH